MERVESHTPAALSSELSRNGTMPTSGRQESLGVLGDWFDAAAGAYTFQQFMDALKK